MKTLIILLISSFTLIGSHANLNTITPPFINKSKSDFTFHGHSLHQPEKTALEFLASLNPEQRRKAQMPLEDSSRVSWHFLPGASWPRKGIRLDELNEKQESLLLDHLKISLSEVGYDLVRHIMGLENVLAELEKRPEYRDPELYTAAFYGHPGKDSLWAWSFEGHHISLNFTIVNDSISIAPRFFGANPATIPAGDRKGERTLAAEEDLGFELIRSMNQSQKMKAILKDHVHKDIVSYNISKADPLSPEGISVRDMNIEQKNTLISIIHQYLSVMPENLAIERMNNLQKEEIDEIHFAWAGAEHPGEPHYYRVQGKTFLIEFDNTQNNANHIHTVWRDFDGDFGRDLIRDHYKTADHNHHRD